MAEPPAGQPGPRNPARFENYEEMWVDSVARMQNPTQSMTQYRDVLIRYGPAFHMGDTWLQGLAAEKQVPPLMERLREFERKIAPYLVWEQHMISHTYRVDWDTCQVGFKEGLLTSCQAGNEEIEQRLGGMTVMQAEQGDVEDQVYPLVEDLHAAEVLAVGVSDFGRAIPSAVVELMSAYAKWTHSTEMGRQ